MRSVLSLLLLLTTSALCAPLTILNPATGRVELRTEPEMETSKAMMVMAARTEEDEQGVREKKQHARL